MGYMRAMGKVGGSSFIVEALDLYKSYGSIRALNGLTLRIRPGEIYGLLGPNGAGKTTTLKILAGLLKPDKGVARICGYDVIDEREKALECIGYIPENPLVFQNLTIEEFLEFIGALRGIPRGELVESMNYYLEYFGLHSKRGELIASLSRGMLQKVLAIASFIVKPKVLLLDEPMAGMDPESQRLFKDEVRRLTKKGATAIVSSHLLDMVERFCTRVGIISNGVLIAEGNLDELKKKAFGGGEASLEEVFLKLVGERVEESV